MAKHTSSTLAATFLLVGLAQTVVGGLLMLGHPLITNAFPKNLRPGRSVLGGLLFSIGVMNLTAWVYGGSAMKAVGLGELFHHSLAAMYAAVVAAEKKSLPTPDFYAHSIMFLWYLSWYISAGLIREPNPKKTF